MRSRLQRHGDFIASQRHCLPRRSSKCFLRLLILRFSVEHVDVCTTEQAGSIVSLVYEKKKREREIHKCVVKSCKLGVEAGGGGGGGGVHTPAY